MVLAVAGIGCLGPVFRGTARYHIDEIVVEEQDKLEAQLAKFRHDAKRWKGESDQRQAERDQLSEELRSINEMADTLGASTSVEDTVNAVYKMIKRRIPFQSCVILLKTGTSLQPALAETPYKDVLAMSHLLQLEETLIKEVMESKKPRLNPELSASSEGRIFKNERSVMCVPLMVTKETVGVIYIGSQKAKTHNEEPEAPQDGLILRGAFHQDGYPF